MTEYDKYFLEHATRNKFIFDGEKGLVLSAKGKSLGSLSKKSIVISFSVNSLGKGFPRARAIWLHYKGDILDGYGVGHVSKDLSDDRLVNLVLTTCSDRSKKAFKNGYIKGTKNKKGKMSVDSVNEDRIAVRLNPDISYDELAKKRGVNRRAMIYALRGLTYPEASEPPVTIRKPTRWFKPKEQKIKETKVKKMPAEKTAREKMSLTENDEIFMEIAKKKGFIFNPETGIVYNKHMIPTGSSSIRSHMFFYTHKGHQHGITRCRAMWLYVNGPIPDGLHPTHKSTNLFDDRIENIELMTHSEAIKKRRGKANTHSSKLTVQLVNELRREAANPKISYNDLVKLATEKLGKTISKTSIIFAIQGRTFKESTEPPVMSKKKVYEKKPRVRKKTVSVKKLVIEKPVVSEDALRICKSLLRNNSKISNEGIFGFLKMRRVESTGITEKLLKQIRREVSLSFNVAA